MTELDQGAIRVSFSEEITIPAKAGSLSAEEVKRLPKTRPGIGLVCDAVADAIRKNPDRLVPHGVTADAIAKAGRMAEGIDRVITDGDTIMVKLRQANLLLDADAYEQLRKVLAFVRAQEKFDPRLADLVPELIRYFAHEKASKAETPV